jgi:hypothetical protein
MARIIGDNMAKTTVFTVVFVGGAGDGNLRGHNMHGL